MNPRIFRFWSTSATFAINQSGSTFAAQSKPLNTIFQSSNDWGTLRKQGSSTLRQVARARLRLIVRNDWRAMQLIADRRGYPHFSRDRCLTQLQSSTRRGTIVFLTTLMRQQRKRLFFSLFTGIYLSAFFWLHSDLSSSSLPPHKPPLRNNFITHVVTKMGNPFPLIFPTFFSLISPDFDLFYYFYFQEARFTFFLLFLIAVGKH